MSAISAQHYRCVVIGASAGGVETLNLIFSSLGEAFPCPIVVVLHLAPGFEFLPQAYHHAVGFKVQEAQEKDILCPGHIYFAPANYHLLIEKDLSLSLSTEEPVKFARPSIDVTFESAADALGGRVIGLLLTGSNDDGARGLKCIHDRGGYTVVEDPTTARFKAMPQSAMNLFQPDAVDSAPRLGALLTRRIYSAPPEMGEGSKWK